MSEWMREGESFASSGSPWGGGAVAAQGGGWMQEGESFAEPLEEPAPTRPYDEIDAFQDVTDMMELAAGPAPDQSGIVEQRLARTQNQLSFVENAIRYGLETGDFDESYIARREELRNRLSRLNTQKNQLAAGIPLTPIEGSGLEGQFETRWNDEGPQFLQDLDQNERSRYSAQLEASREDTSQYAPVRVGERIAKGLVSFAMQGAQRMIGDREGARETYLDYTADAQANAEAGGRLENIVAGAGESIAKAVPAGMAGGLPGVIAAFFADTYMQSEESALSRGLSADEARGYALASAGTEAAITAAFSLAGAGGFESMVTKAVGRDGRQRAALEISRAMKEEGAEAALAALRRNKNVIVSTAEPTLSRMVSSVYKKMPELFKQQVAEQLEEGLVSQLQYGRDLRTFGGEWSLEQAVNIGIDTAATTFLAVGAMRAADPKVREAIAKFAQEPSRANAKAVGLEYLGTKARREKVAEGVKAAAIREQLHAMVGRNLQSPEEADYLYGMLQARAESAGMTLDAYVAKNGLEFQVANWEEWSAANKDNKGVMEMLAEPAFENLPEPAQQQLAETKVVDEEGKPRSVYHRTPADFDGFSIEKAESGDYVGVYFAETPAAPTVAPDMGDGTRTIPAYLNLKNPATNADKKRAIQKLGPDWTPQQLTDALKADGFDGVIDTDYRVAEYVAFDPQQVVNALTGEVMAEQPLAEKQPGKKKKANRAQIQFLRSEGRTVITAFEQADFASLVHELGHLFRQDLAGADLNAAARWAGVKKGRWSRDAEEKFADAFLKWVAEGKGPTPAVTRFFEKFAGYLTSLFDAHRKARMAPLKLTPEITGVFGRLMGEGAVLAQQAQQEAVSRAPVDAPDQPEAIFQINTGTPTGAPTASRSQATVDPPVPAGHVRWYHGGIPGQATGSIWMTRDPNDAIGWASRDPDMRVMYVDIKEQDLDKYDPSGSLRGDLPNGYAPLPRFEFPREVANSVKVLPSSNNASSAGSQPTTLAEAEQDPVSLRFRDLANHEVEEARRKAVFEADVASGDYKRISRAAEDARALERIAANPAQERAFVMQMVESVERGVDVSINNVADQYVVHYMRRAAIDVGDRALTRRINRMLRASRTLDAQKMGWRDPVEKRAGNYAQFVKQTLDTALTLDPPEVADKRATARTPEEHAALDAEAEAWVQRLIEKLAAVGVDINDLEALANDPIGATKVIELIRKSRGELEANESWIFEYWRNSILSGPQTQIVNPVSTLAFAALVYGIERPAQAAVDAIYRRGKGKGVRFGEIGPAASGFLRGFFPALRNFGYAFVLTRPMLEESLGRLGETKLDTRPGAIPGKLGSLIRVPYKLLTAADDFTKTIIAHMEVGAVAYRVGKNRGMTGEDLGSFIESEVKNTNSASWDAAIDTAQQIAFQGEGGAVSTPIQNLIKAVQVNLPYGTGKFLVPFRKTPANIFEEGIRRMPIFGAVLDLVEGARAGKPFKLSGKNDEFYTGMFARQAVAIGLASALWALNDDDEPWITGAKDLMDRNDKRTQYGAIPAMSIRVPGVGWVSYARLEPIATYLSATVDAINGLKSGGSKQGAKDLAANAILQLTNKSYLDSVGDIIEGIIDFSQGESGGMYRWGTKFGASFVPNVWRQTVSPGYITQNRIWGKDEEFLKMALQRTAEQARLVEPYPLIDPWGREVPFSGQVSDFWTRLINPFRIADEDRITQMDMAVRAWNRQNPKDKTSWATPEYHFQRRGETHYLTTAEYVEYSKRAGQYALERAEKINVDVEKPTKTQMTAIANAMAAGRRRARNELMPQWLERIKNEQPPTPAR